MKKTIKTTMAFMLVLSSWMLCAGDAVSPYDAKIKELMGKMTLEEKVGQLTQYSGVELTGPQGEPIDLKEYVRQGKVGSFLNITGTEDVKEIQEIAVKESRLGIPLMFGLDVIHGYRTIFPAPLALASSWNPELVKECQAMAASEASAAGVNWTFAPMLDIARDPRWGRIVEGFGEDPYLASLLAEASVKGFQGEKLNSGTTVMACAKHYAAYGAVQAGREYAHVDVSERTLYEIYLPPFHAAVKAGVGSVMPAFTEINSIPMTENKHMLRDVLRQDWGFKGVTVSDWNAVQELINHGVALTNTKAAELAINGGTNIDMVSGLYLANLPKLVKEGKVKAEIVDDAVYWVLLKKFELGLFDNPYLYCNAEREKKDIMTDKNRQIARAAARESIVLLKNDNNFLPLSKNIRTIAVIGPLAQDKQMPLGPWNAKGEAQDTVSVYQGIKEAVSKDTRVLYSYGCGVYDIDDVMIQAAVNTASRADVIVAVLGETAEMSGEASSRTELSRLGVQGELLKKLYNTGVPLVLVMMNGRPLVLTMEKKYLPAIVETWYLGTEAGHAIADVLFGDYNPSGKLPVTFPYSVGQIPIYYNYKESGRPNDYREQKFVSKYLDIPNSPLYPFGYGLSYSTFEYSDIELSCKKARIGESVTARIKVSNTSSVAGQEVVQLYIREKGFSVERPVKELKNFKKIMIQPGTTAEVSFTISPEDMKYLNEKMENVNEPGVFDVFIGTNSSDCKKATFELTE